MDADHLASFQVVVRTIPRFLRYDSIFAAARVALFQVNIRRIRLILGSFVNAAFKRLPKRSVQVTKAVVT